MVPGTGNHKGCPYDGFVPIFIAMTGCGWAAFGIPMAL